MDDPNSTPPEISQDLPVKRPLYPPPPEAFMVLFITLAASILLGWATISMGKVGLFSAEILFIIPPLVYLKRKGYNVRRCLRWNGVSWKVLLATIFIGLALVILLDEADRLVNIFLPMPPELQNALMNLFALNTWTDYLVVGLGVVVIAAFCEESLFRGFMQVSFEAHGNVTRAVVFTALLFALVHFNPWWMMQILILGVFLGFISWRSAGTIPGMVVHGLNNGLALLAGGDTTGAGWSWYNSGHHVAPAILIGAAALLFTAFKFFIRFTESTFQPEVIADEASAA